MMEEKTNKINNLKENTSTSNTRDRYITTINYSNYEEVQNQKFMEKIKETQDLKSIPRINKIIFLSFALILAYIFRANIFFKAQGIIFPIFWSLFFIVTYFITKDKIEIKNMYSIVSICATLIMSIHVSFRHMEHLRYIDSILVIPLCAVSTFIYARFKKVHEEIPNEYKEVNEDINLLTIVKGFKSLFIYPFLSFKNIFYFLKNNNELSKNESNNENSINGSYSKKNKKEIILGLLFGLLILVVVVPLLISSDENIKNFISSLNLKLSFDFLDEIRIDKIIATLFFFFYFFGLATSFRNKYTEYVNYNRSNYNPTIINIALIMVNILYLLYTLIQVKTLYLQDKAILESSTALSSYAREGFFSLLLVIAINFTLILIIGKHTKDKNFTKLNILLLILVFFTVALILSSFYRMGLYESMYGYTHLRLFVKVSLIFFSLLSILAIFFILNRRLKVVTLAFILALSLFSIPQLLNIDAIIAKNAITTYEKTKKIDINYISDLSYDAKDVIDLYYTKSNDPTLKSISNEFNRRVLQKEEHYNLENHD